MIAHQRHIRLDGAHNVRDLGGYATMSGGMTRWRSFLRADALHRLSAEDAATLLDLGVRTVIDLRSDFEIARQPSVLAAKEDIRYHHIPIFDGLAPTDAILRERRVIDLAERYMEAADSCRPALLKVAATIAEAENGIVLFNCTAGKDRTGIVAAMLLSIAGVANDQIASDYALTAEVAAALMQRLKEAAILRGVDVTQAARLLSSDRAAMIDFLQHIDDRYAGFRNYLLLDRQDHDFVSLIHRRFVTQQA